MYKLIDNYIFGVYNIKYGKIYIWSYKIGTQKMVTYARCYHFFVYNGNNKETLIEYL